MEYFGFFLAGIVVGLLIVYYFISNQNKEIIMNYIKQTTCEGCKYLDYRYVSPDSFDRDCIFTCKKNNNEEICYSDHGIYENCKIPDWCPREDVCFDNKFGKLKDRFVKCCTNQCRSFDYNKDGEKVRMLYRHPDLDELSEKAFNDGRNFFYVKAKYPNDKYGKQIECEPEYVYEFRGILSEKEYNEIFEN